MHSHTQRRPYSRSALLSLVGMLAITTTSIAQDTAALRGGRRLQEWQQQTQDTSWQQQSDQLPQDSPFFRQEQQEQPQELLSEAAEPQQQQQEQNEQTQVEEVQLTEQELHQKQMISYLGGLVPAVDSNILPLYLRDVQDLNGGYRMDLYGGNGEPVLRDRDLVFFWHIPRTGGATLKNILNFCYGLRRAEQLENEPSMEYVRNNILNMDTASPDGLRVSYEQNIVNSNMLDMISSNYFLSGSALFNEGHFGKTFTILRHPVDLALSLFFHRRKYIPVYNQITVHDYVSSDGYMDNWMVRQLTGTMPWVELSEKHLEQAKLTMKTKIFIGVNTEMDETIRQLKAHYGWEDIDKKNWPPGFEKPYEETCEYKYLEERANEINHPDIPGGRGGRTWKVFVEKEKWDMGLYYFGLELFAEQRNRYPPKDVLEVEQE